MTLPSATYRNFPAWSIAIPLGRKLPGAANGEPATGERLPLDATLNTVTDLLSGLLANSSRSFGLSKTTFELSPKPGVNGESGRGVNEPLVAMSKTSTVVAAPDVPANNCRPEQLISALVRAPTNAPANGEPATGASVPSVAILNIATALMLCRAAARNFPSGEILMPWATASIANGEPGTRVRLPEDGFTEKPLTSSLPALDT